MKSHCKRPLQQKTERTYQRQAHKVFALVFVQIIHYGLQGKWDHSFDRPVRSTLDMRIRRWRRLATKRAFNDARDTRASSSLSGSSLKLSVACKRWRLASEQLHLHEMDPKEYILNLRVLGIIFSTFYIWPNVLKYIHIQTCGTCVRMYQPPLLSGHSSPVGVSNLAEDGPLPLFSPFTILSFSPPPSFRPIPLGCK